ncbi:MAG TPA: phytoene/squalene synthase family protein [Nitrospiraceae bacterium]|nr:phytoene/squalene synthase family protein [Nitrospiraceae bacterium]
MLPTDTSSFRRSLLRDILKQVSRSFYLTLAVVPANVRDQIGLSYLFARAADTIADTDVIERAQRLQFLKQFRAQFAGEQVSWDAIRGIQTALAPRQTDSAERVLLQRLEDCFRLYLDCTQDDRLRIRRLMGTLPNGMEMDLARFPGDTARDLMALKTLNDLDQYTYYVAGCVGEFWTDMTCGHRPALAGWNVKEMSAAGVRFGKGLQLTNILKDMAKDLQRGRCYVPETMLKEADLTPKDLLQRDKADAFRPVLRKLLTIAREHLDQGWLYTMAIPRWEIRLRLSCMWPILFAGETLRVVAASPDLLNSSVTLKISRARVYGIMALTILTGACGYVGTAYWGWVRKQIM